MSVKEVGLNIETAGIRQFGAWCAAADVDEWTALLQMTGGDHAAMTLLRFALRWGESLPVKAAGGWFYREAKKLEKDAFLTRDLLERSRKCLKSRLGMQERKDHPHLPGGGYLLTVVLHYRLDPVVLRAAFDVYCLEESARTVCKTLAELQAIIKNSIPEVVKKNIPAKATSNIPEMVQDNIPTMLDGNTAGMRQNNAYKESTNQASNQATNQATKSSLSTAGASDDAEREMVHPERIDLPTYLGKLFDRLGTPNGQTAKILEQCKLLGDSTAQAVAERCKDKAGSWQYVLNALVGEASKPQVQVRIADRARAEESDRLWREEQAAGLIVEPVNIFNAPPLPVKLKRPAAFTGAGAEAWNVAREQLRLQMDENKFEMYLREAVLVDVCADRFTIDVLSDQVRELLQNRLRRVVCKALDIALGRKADVLFVTANPQLVTQNHIVGSGNMVGAVAL